jgi:propanol-preferring alcohol dehydrogenase
MVFDGVGLPLRETHRPAPQPGPGEIRLRVRACGVCRTDLHIIDGELSEPALPLVPGHQIVGTVDAVGPAVDRFAMGERVGVPWLGGSCGACRYCLSDRENLCDRARFTGYQIDGGYAEHCIADADFCFALPNRASDAGASDGASDAEVAPLLCAGLIGYRAWKLTGDAERVGFYGFGASAHILIQIARHQGREVYAFTRPGDQVAQRFAQELGAAWAGDSDARPPTELDAAILFAPVGDLVPAALRAVSKGGVVVCAGIHMSDIPSFPYALLWGERVVRSVANLTRRDGEEFFPLAVRAGVRTQTTGYPLAAANRALDDLRQGRISGAAVLEMPG